MSFEAKMSMSTEAVKPKKESFIKQHSMKNKWFHVTKQFDRLELQVDRIKRKFEFTNFQQKFLSFDNVVVVEV